MYITISQLIDLGVSRLGIDARIEATSGRQVEWTQTQQEEMKSDLCRTIVQFSGSAEIRVKIGYSGPTINYRFWSGHFSHLKVAETLSFTLTSTVGFWPGRFLDR